MNQPRATLAAGMQVTPSVRLVSPVGSGGMGAVWLADHTALNTRVVVKFMLVGLDSSASARTRFKREAEAASLVKSPHVVQTFDYGVTKDGLPFIVMEHLEGRDLGAEIAAHGALDPAKVVGIVWQVAKALSKAHSSGVLHRDIKPDNIFLCESDQGDEQFVKLLDFGIAKSRAPEGEAELDGQTKTGQVVGTPFYMSPEQVTAQKVIDLRSDLWALGIVAFEALTGKRPFDGPSFGALAVKIATTDPPKPSAENPALPPSVDAWFAQACAREPSARFKSARELAERFRAAFEGVVSLPPAISGMSESGPHSNDSGSRPTPAARSAFSSDSGAGSGSDPNVAHTAVDTRVPRTSNPMSSVPSGPISVDHDAHDRASFVLASTASDAKMSDSNALARSEGGASVAITGSRSPKGKALVLGGMVALLTAAIAVGWLAKSHSPDGTTPAQGSSGNPSALATTAPNPPTASTPSASPTATAFAPVVTAAEDAGHPVAVTTAPLALIPNRPMPTGRPVPTTATSASSKATTTTPLPSARPSTTSHDDPLF